MTVSHPGRTATAAGAAPPDVVDVADSRRRIRPGRYALTVALVLLALWLARFFVTNPNFEWDVVGEYLFYPTVLEGLVTSLLLAVVAMALGTGFGAVLAVARIGDFGPARWASTAFVAVFRSIPPLVQLIFWFNLGFLVPRLELGLPGGPSLGSWTTTELITPLSAAIIGLTLHESAYMAEIIRSGLLSVTVGAARRRTRRRLHVATDVLPHRRCRRRCGWCCPRSATSSSPP